MAGPPPNRPDVGVRPEEHVCLDARRHTVVLARPLGRAVLFALGGIVLLALPWPLFAAGAIVLALAALLAVVAVLRWDRTRFVVTTEKVFLVQGVTRRRASAVMLSSLRLVALDQSLPGRMLGYGTLQAGPLEVEYVPHAKHVRDLVERLAA
jgi:uncharacterized membrane protein YdbT with pleckstrin-like domain